MSQDTQASPEIGKIVIPDRILRKPGSERCYKNAMTKEEAFRIIYEESGTHFDPKLAKVFLDHRGDFISIIVRLED